MQRIYLDHAATTPVRPEVLEAMLPHFAERGYNASSLHGEGRAARAALDDARDTIARLLGAKRKEIVFTGSGSEADNMALAGVARRNRHRGLHIVSTTIEHHAVLHALDALQDDGFEITLLPVSADGEVSPAAFAAALRPDTILASVMYANNEIGTIEPIAELAAIAHERGVVFHTDAVQAPGYLPLAVGPLGVDLLSIAAHKFYGPTGVGALYVRDGVAIAPLVRGGSQEFGRRAGTENVPGIVGMARALELTLADWERDAQATAALRDRLEAALCAGIPGLRVNGARKHRLANHLSIAVPGVESEQLLVRLDLEGVAVSAGSACTSGALEISHVVEALGLPSGLAASVLRLTLGRATDRAAIDRVGALLPRLAREMLATDAPR
ncbi:MAG: cysteine desulfurase [Candidatus Eremiobacteraeota bacterium]|nr:cysteine desulfurase [Candidatus Eremiobacteraeota bacterium]